MGKTDATRETLAQIAACASTPVGAMLTLPARAYTEADRAAMKVVIIFPSFLLLPPAALAVEPDHEQLRAGMQAGLEMVNGEDELATALVQKAAGSHLASRCLLSPGEGVLGGFYRYLARQLTEAGTPGDAAT